jgi:hypothetical protein
MNDSNRCNESIYLPCWLLSTQYSATEERKEMFYKDTNFAIGLHSEHSRQSLLFFSLLSNNYADPDLSVLTVTVKFYVYSTLCYAIFSGHQLCWYSKVTLPVQTARLTGSANSSAWKQ